MAHRHTQPHDINSVERARQAIILRKMGYTLSEIAQRCGYNDKSGAYRAIKRWLDTLPKEDAEDLRKMEGARLDELLKVYLPKAIKGDKGAALIVLRIGEQRARLFGLFIAPTDPEVEPVRIVVRQVPAGWIPELAASSSNGHIPVEVSSP